MDSTGCYRVKSRMMQVFFKRAAVEMGDFFMDKNDADYVLFPVT